MQEHPFELDAVAILYHLMQRDDLYQREKEQGQIERPFLEKLALGVRQYTIENEWDGLVFVDKATDPDYFQQKKRDYADFSSSAFPLPDFFFHKQKAFYYPSPEEETPYPKENYSWILQPEDELYSLCFTYQLRILQSEQLRPFLIYTYERVGAGFQDFVKRARLDYGSILREIVWEYVLQELVPDIENSPQNYPIASPNFTRKQWSLLFHFAFKSMGFDPTYGEFLPFIAKLLHLTTGHKYTQLKNSDYYNYLRKGPLLSNDRRLLSDLQKVRSTLIEVGLKKAVKEVDKLIEETQNELKRKD